MSAVPVLVGGIVALVLVLLASSVLEGQIAGGLRRLWPSASYNGTTTLLVGLLALAGFAVGVLVMYLAR